MERPSTDRREVGADGPFRFDTPSYERLLRRVREAGRRFVGFDEREAGVALQHDVSLSLDRALAMARLEATLRVEATYCVPLDAPLHDTSTVTFANTVRTLSQLGHEVGLLFDPHAHWEDAPGDAAVRRRVDDRREVLARLVDEPIEVVSFRNPTPRLRALELDGAVNADRPPADVPDYHTVTDREWRRADAPPGSQARQRSAGSASGSGFPFPDGVPPRFRLLVHPGLWHPVERDEAAVLEDYRRAVHERVDAYFDAFAGPPADD